MSAPAGRADELAKGKKNQPCVDDETPSKHGSIESDDFAVQVMRQGMAEDEDEIEILRLGINPNADGIFVSGGGPTGKKKARHTPVEERSYQPRQVITSLCTSTTTVEPRRGCRYAFPLNGKLYSRVTEEGYNTEIPRYWSPIQKISVRLIELKHSNLITSFGVGGATPYYFQKDSWSCGYRNIIMILGSLTIMFYHEENAFRSTTVGESGGGSDRTAERCLPYNVLPMSDNGQRLGVGVDELQLILEQAWSEGFDPYGASLFEPIGVRGTRRWIGAIEAYVILSSLGLRCKVVDFEGLSGSMSAAEAVLEWLKEYFLLPGDAFKAESTDEFTSADVRTQKIGNEPCRGWAEQWRSGITHCVPPVLLQHDTHSQTVVGVLEHNRQYSLILLDPAVVIVDSDFDKQDWERFVVVSKATLERNSQYQIVHVLPGIHSEMERKLMLSPNKNTYKR